MGMPGGGGKSTFSLAFTALLLKQAARPVRPLTTEWQILFDAINIGWPENLGFFQRPPTFGVFALQQVAPAGAPKQHFTGAGQLETFGHGLSGFNAFGTSHISSFFGNQGLVPPSTVR
jgi:hypothetical protein